MGAAARRPVQTVFRYGVDTRALVETFKPAINWDDQIIVSAAWIVEAWAISAVCALVIAAALIRYTTGAKRFWRIT